MRLLIFFLFFTLSLTAQPLITVRESLLNTSIAGNLVYYKDSDKSISPTDFLKLNPDGQQVLKDDIANLDFQNARFYFRFNVKNELDRQFIYLETARPITNKVFLHRIVNGKIEKTLINGDSYPFSARRVKNKTPLFEIELDPGQTGEYLLEVESDGEMISLPFIFHSEKSLNSKIYNTQFASGFYYGVLIFVAILFLFFYLLLRDLSFLYYVLYTFFLSLMQFSLDGYAYQYFFPSSPWLANHIVLFASGITSVFVILYCKSYLETKKNLPVYDKVINYFLILIIVVIGFSLTNGILYRISYPLINGLALVALVLVNLAIFLSIRKGLKISPYFTIAFTLLIAGAIIFILGNFNLVGNPNITLNALKISSLIEIVLLSITMAYKYRDLQMERNEANKLLLNQYAEKNKLIEEINQKLESEVKERVKYIELQKSTIEEKNKSIMDSIEYALRIQKTILPSREKVLSLLPKSYVFYKPKDIVSGDFYFVESTHTTLPGAAPRQLTLFSVIDCTGHGVPGALMSLIAFNNLKKGLTERNVNSPSEALNHLDLNISQSLRTDDNDEIRDGMDIGMCAYDSTEMKLSFSGAHHNLYLFRKSLEEAETLPENVEVHNLNSCTLYEFKGAKRAIGNSGVSDQQVRFQNTTFKLQKDDVLYLFSDGFQDQFGGSNQKKFGRKNFREMLEKSLSLPWDKRCAFFEQEFCNYLGETEQIDDVLVFGVEI